MSITIEQFVEHLTQSGLMSAEEIDSFHKQLPPERQPKDVQQFAQALVQQGKLTKYQAQAVYQGKTKGLVFGQYVVLDKLGEGGMGVVLKARHRRMDRLVAIKVLSASTMKEAGAIERFHRGEVMAAAKLSPHPNIVTAHDADEYQGMHYLVMEYVEGSNLADIVRDIGSLSLLEAVDCVFQAAQGLRYAHGEGIVHRDIKPGNLILDKKGTVKILDLGLARIAARAETSSREPLTRTGQVMGTYEYMAPEQWLDTHRADARADIYALGCTLYRLLTGQPPYPGETAAQIFLAHREQPIPSLRAARPDVPAELDELFRKMVAKEPEDRYQSMTEVVADLEVVRGALAARPATVPPVIPEPANSGLAAAVTFFQEGKPRGTVAVQPEAAAEEDTQPSISQQDTGTNISGKVRRARRRPLVLAGLAGGLVLLLGLGIVLTFKPKNPPLPPVAGDGTGDRRREGPPALAVSPFDAKQAKERQDTWAKYLGVSVEMTNSISMKLVLIPPGEFTMGSPKELIEEELPSPNLNEQSKNARLGEGPQHRVRITKPFYFGTYLVTQREYQRVMGVNPSDFSREQMDVSLFKPPLSENSKRSRRGNLEKVDGHDTSRHPVERVNWDEATEFCHRLSAMPAEQAARRVYRLPTEAEWEYACRAGTTTRCYCGDNEQALSKCAWIKENSGGMTHPVGEKKPNPWGLYDIHGNLSEWCLDHSGNNYYEKSPTDDPEGPLSGELRVRRGGAFNSPASSPLSSRRGAHFQNLHIEDVGLRVAMALADTATERAEMSRTTEAAHPAADSPVDAKPHPADDDRPTP